MFDHFLVWLKEYLCSANIEDQDQADQEDETKRVLDAPIKDTWSVWFCSEKVFAPYWKKHFLTYVAHECTWCQIFQKILNWFQQTRSQMKNYHFMHWLSIFKASWFALKFVLLNCKNLLWQDLDPRTYPKSNFSKNTQPISTNKAWN